MDVDLSPQDLAFQQDVRDFLATNAHDPKTDYGQWRLNWFELARLRADGMYPNGRQIWRPGLDSDPTYLGKGNRRRADPTGSAFGLNAGTGLMNYGNGSNSDFYPISVPAKLTGARLFRTQRRV